MESELAELTFLWPHQITYLLWASVFSPGTEKFANLWGWGEGAGGNILETSPAQDSKVSDQPEATVLGQEHGKGRHLRSPYCVLETLLAHDTFVIGSKVLSVQ